MTATVTGVEAANGGELLKHWWQWVWTASKCMCGQYTETLQVLVALGLASIVIGASYMVLDLSMKLRRLWVARVRYISHSVEAMLVVRRTNVLVPPATLHRDAAVVNFDPSSEICWLAV